MALKLYIEDAASSTKAVKYVDDAGGAPAAVQARRFARRQLLGRLSEPGAHRRWQGTSDQRN